MIITAARVDDARTSGGKTLPQLLLDRAQAHPERACMREKRHGVWVSYTWRDVIERVERTARGLAALGLQRGDVLAILSENIVESFWTEYAALALGARVVFAYPDLTAQELLYILDHSEAKMLLAEDQEQVDKFLAIKSDLLRIARVIYVDPRGLWNYCEPLLRGYADLERAGETASADAIRSAIAAGDQDDVAAICYTSGTTGRPKGAMLSHRFLLENAYRIMAAHSVRPHAEYLSYISPAWATEQFMGFALGLLAPLVVNFAEKPDTVKRDLREVGPEYLLFTPRQWEMLASDVQAHMLDAGPIRRALYGWAVKTGAAAREPEAGFLQRRLALPIAERLVLRPIRDVLGLSKTRAVLSGGSGLVGGSVPAFPCARRIVAQHLWQHRTWRSFLALRPRLRSRDDGRIAAERSDHRAADRGMGRCERTTACALLRVLRLSQERSRDRRARPRRRWFLHR